MRFILLAAITLANGVTAAQTTNPPASTILKTKASIQTLPAGVSKITTIEGINEYRLENGLKVLLLPDASKPTVAVNITYLVGSRHENYGETGMAHLLEHLVFKGTPKNPKITEEFNKRGFRMNGTTSIDRTNYFELFQASEENLKWAIELEADRMVNSYIAKKDLDTEMTVVRNEYERGENNPTGVLIKRLQSVAFDWHNYGNSTIGNRSDIENIKIENLQAFYRMYYQPDNAVLTIAGKFDEAKTLAWIAKSFTAIKKPSRQLPQLWTVEPTQDGERSFVVRRKGDIQFVAVAYKIPSSLHRDTDALSYAASILASGANSRLHKQLVETGKAVQIFPIGLSGYAPGLQVIGAAVKKGEALEPVRDAIVAAMEEFANTPPTKDEIERVRRENLNSIEKTLTNHESIGIGMSEIIALGDWRLFFQSRDLEASVTSDQVAAATKRYFKRDNRTIGSFIPEDAPQRADIPAAPSLTEAMAGFKPKTTVLSAENFDPSPANIDKRTVRSKIGGLDVAMLVKKSKGETVSVVITPHWGDEKTLMGKKWVASLTNNLLARGTSQYSRAQIADEMSKLKMTGSVNRFDTTKENLTAALTLAAHIMQNATFPESEFAQSKKTLLTQIESQKNEPQMQASIALAEHFNRYPKGDMRASETIEEMIANINVLTLEDVKAFYKQFHGMSKAEVSIVGDFDAKEAGKTLESNFANWKSASTFTRLNDAYVDIPAMKKVINTPDKENGIYMAQMNLPIKDDDADYPALFIANYIFGGGAGMNSRVMERIRQKDGLSYGGGSRLIADSFDHSGRLSISATAAPQNIAKVDVAIKEELTRALKDGFSKEEVERAKSGLLQQRVQSRSDDVSLAGGLASNLYRNRNMSFAQAIDDKIAKLTVDEVNTAFRKMIAPEKFSVVFALDEVKAKASTTPATK
ncbi:M16 family metallopeptidase [Undibacterium sp. Ji22W]|uniref:M16 family metallopeptidase n=1 Tax=Undibacterium sp. Ji22W TaxID=3413038 RepID=UPI003BF36DEE